MLLIYELLADVFIDLQPDSTPEIDCLRLWSALADYSERGLINVNGLFFTTQGLVLQRRSPMTSLTL